MKDEFTVNELQALKACFTDAIHFRNMLVYISELKECGLLINGFMSEVSMFVIESYDCLVKIAPEVKLLFDTVSIEALRKSRHRAKILEYTKDINSGLNYLSLIDIKQTKFFQIHNTSLFCKLKQFIQPDMGITKYQGHFITTTHSTVFDMGPDAKIESEYFFSIGEVIRIYLQTIIEKFEIDEVSINSDYVFSKNDYQILDIKSKSLFKRSNFQESNKRFAPALILILVRLNYTKMITSQFLSKNSHTLIRLKFINIYHACQSLTKIQSLVMKGAPTENEIMFFKTIFSNKNVKWLLTQTSLRNLFVHYLLDKKQLKRMPDNYTREEAIYILSGGLSFEDLEKILDITIENITIQIESFYKLNNNTFWINKIDNEL